MNIHIYLLGSLRDYLPSQAKGRATLQMEAGSSVADLLAHLGIRRRVAVALNDEHEPDSSYLLEDGDRVSVYSITGGG